MNDLHYNMYKCLQIPDSKLMLSYLWRSPIARATSNTKNKWSCNGRFIASDVDTVCHCLLHVSLFPEGTVLCFLFIFMWCARKITMKLASTLISQETIDTFSHNKYWNGLFIWLLFFNTQVVSVLLDNPYFILISLYC